MEKPFMKIGVLGLLVAGMSVVLMMVFPSKAPWMMEGFRTPIIAFEFVQTAEEVQQLFGTPHSEEQQGMIRAMDLGNRLDYLYLVLYSAFLFLFSFVCVKITGQKRYYAACILAVLVLAGDSFENIQLMGITSKINEMDYSRQLVLLKRFTWMKWGGIGIVFLVLSPYFLSGGIFSKVIGTVGIFSAFLSVMAYINRTAFTEWMGFSVALMFVLMISYSFVHSVAGHTVESHKKSL